MCRARFESTRNRPFVTASVVFPRLEIGNELNFILDTGADVTCVTQFDAFGGGFHPALLSPGVEITGSETQGVGGSSTDYFVHEEALLAFEEYNQERERYSLHIEHVPGIRISEGSPANLLGRDLLYRFRMKYDPIDGFIELERDNFGGGRYQCFNGEQELSSSLRSFGEE